MAYMQKLFSISDELIPTQHEAKQLFPTENTFFQNSEAYYKFITGLRGVADRFNSGIPTNETEREKILTMLNNTQMNLMSKNSWTRNRVPPGGAETVRLIDSMQQFPRDVKNINKEAEAAEKAIKSHSNIKTGIKGLLKMLVGIATIAASIIYLPWVLFGVIVTAAVPFALDLAAFNFSMPLTSLYFRGIKAVTIDTLDSGVGDLRQVLNIDKNSTQQVLNSLSSIRNLDLAVNTSPPSTPLQQREQRQVQTNRADSYEQRAQVIPRSDEQRAPAIPPLKKPNISDTRNIEEVVTQTKNTKRCFNLNKGASVDALIEQFATQKNQSNNSEGFKSIEKKGPPSSYEFIFPDEKAMNDYIESIKLKVTELKDPPRAINVVGSLLRPPENTSSREPSSSPSSSR